MNVRLQDLRVIYEQEIKKRVKNKRKIFMFERNKFEYLCEMKRELDNGTYQGGKYNVFVVFRPKLRVVMSQGIYDKTINHYVTRFILMPKFEKYLSPYNCATRKDMGTSFAIKLLKRLIEKYKKTNREIYYAKLDISKYFYTIDHHKVLSLIRNELSEEEYELVKTILETTNREYVNKYINYFSRKYKMELPLYYIDKGLPIGNMTSQFLAVFYLSKVHHYITHNLHLDFVNYMDDYIFLSNDKAYLESCLKEIANIIEKEYLLRINSKKTYIANIKNGLPFLGHVFYVKNGKTIVRLTESTKRGIKRGIKRSKYYFESGLIDFNQLFCSIETYKYSYAFIKDKTVENIINRYWY